MTESYLAATDLVTAIPSFWESIKVPLSIIVIVAAVVAAIISIRKGIGSALGVLIGGIAIAALVLGAVGLTASFKETLDKHCNGCTVGQYGR
ncbi:hypothetical protein KL864_25500 [Mycolicibacterium goodii]|uniref:hypothetical protein n=1 Tax=Mycolicibacterium goodii TaxID=134601 RepID=UPI001BDC50C3|nr:hypothetical protein [Mycolicibacterium goodii]MBU8819254.1 hypothetical protein [Mycolicibacterium goodii]